MNATVARLFDKMNDIIFGVSLLENMGCTRHQVKEIIETGSSLGVSSQNIIKLNNFKHALYFLEENYGYPLELGALVDYNAIIGQDDPAHMSPGFIRDDQPVHISRCSYVAPPVTAREALLITNEYHSYENIADKVAYLAVALPKTQLFYDGNKRTALLACNHVLCNANADMVFSIVPDPDGYQEYIEILLRYYEDDISLKEAMGEVKRFLN